MGTISYAAILALSMAAAADDLAVLPASEGVTAPNELVVEYLLGEADKAFARRAKTLEALKTPEELAAHQERMRAFFIERLGGFPERTPLNPRVVDRREGDGFRVEKIIFESRPNFFVTAALFLPTTDAPYPAVLIPCGHSSNGKGAAGYQQGCIFLARSGMAALIYDPIGQGERSQLLKPDGTQKHGSTFEHTLVGVGAMLVGHNTATFRIWDGMRAIDYLCSRDDVDPDNIGCAGNSGGGTLSSYIMALDDRVKCAAPSCYITSYARLLEKAGPQDAEQNIAGQIAFGMDHGDYAILRAPKPTLICASTYDFFDIRGTWDAFRDAKRFYSKMGYPERVDLAEAPEKHGWSELPRQSCVRWMRRWLQGIDDAVVEAESVPLTDEEIQCTPKGQVLLLEGARSAFDISAEQESALAVAREQFWRDTPRAQALDAVRAVAKIRPLAEVPVPDVTEGDTIQRDGYTIRKLVLQPEGGMPVPALLLTPDQANGTTCLYVNGEGKAAAVDGPIEALVKQGCTVLAPDITGIGETRSDWGAGGWSAVLGPDWKTVYLAYLLDKPYLAMRTEDVMMCARYLGSLDSTTQGVDLVAVGEAAPAGLHAAALESGVFASVRLEQCVRSWAGVVRTPEAVHQLANAVHGALRVYDLPDLVATLSDKVEVLTPVNASGRPL
ncbi:MAG: hypothetical protein GY851_21920 [bacterium]|nr:hypothetical protein [bacterium]